LINIWKTFKQFSFIRNSFVNILKSLEKSNLLLKKIPKNMENYPDNMKFIFYEKQLSNVHYNYSMEKTRFLEKKFLEIWENFPGNLKKNHGKQF
jgi:hypothetical protein